MAAPDNIVWGPEVNTGEYPGKLGIYSVVTTTDTHVLVDIQVWIWTKESCKDSGNTLYLDVAAGITEATTGMGFVYVNTPSNTNWSESNKQLVYTAAQTSFKRGKIDYAYNVCAKLTGVEYGGGDPFVTATITVPKLVSYTVTYNANGGTGSPSSQTKYYGQALTLTSNKPSRSGYTFAGWATSASGSVRYSPGGTYSANADLKLYAVWTSNAITITFDSNGGDTDPPSPIVTSYGTEVVFPSYTPSKLYYNFLGWATSSSGLVKYSPGETYSVNANMTLYAVWEKAYEPPLIYNLKVDRCSADGTLTDEGTYARVSFDWECNTSFTESYPLDEVYIAYADKGGNKWTTSHYSYPNTLTGSICEIVGEGNLDPDKEYDIRVSVGDVVSYQEFYRTIYSQRFPIDVLKGGKGVAFGCPATDEGVAKFAYSLLLNRGDGLYKTLIDLIHPVGSVITLYPMAKDLTSDGKLTEGCDIHPNNQYPGTTWERINERFLWATSEGGKIGNTGGDSTKTLSVANLPAHTHGATYSGNASTKSYPWLASGGSAMGYEAISTGSGTAFDIMPPYVQVAMFRRVG